MAPISLSDEELAIVRSLASPLAPHERCAYLREVAAELKKHPVLGPGIVSRAALLVQRRMLDGDHQAKRRRERAEARFRQSRG
jgi:hypothetical protein